MRSVDNWLDRFCAKHPRLAIPRLVQYVLIGTVIVFFFDLFSQGALSDMLAFIPAEILRGQLWRLVTFVVVPGETRLFFFAMEVYFIWWSTTLVEREWGAAKLTLFYCTGVVLNILVGFLLGGVFSLMGVSPMFPTTTVWYLNTSLLFAFATLMPNLRLLLFMILPIKAKWLGWFVAALMAYDIFSGVFEASSVQGLVFGLIWSLLFAVPALISIANYFLFFWSHITRVLRRGHGAVRHRTSRQTVEFKKAVNATKEAKGYLHKCAVCGRTDADSPGLEFRYCSKCNGYYCYCADHIHTHVHIE